MSAPQLPAAPDTATPGAAWAAEVRRIYELAPAEELQVDTLVRMLDELAELEREAEGAHWVIVGTRGAEQANPLRAMLMRARREVRDALARLNLPHPDAEETELSPSEMAVRLARRRWAGRGAS